MAAEVKERDERQKGLPPDILGKYQMLLEKRQGLAVASVSNGVCHACNMNLRPQLYIELQKQQTLILCPNCSRILFWENGRRRLNSRELGAISAGRALSDEQDLSPPTSEAVVSYLAQTLSVSKTLKRFPSLKPKDLQQILERCARLISEGEPKPSVSSPGPGIAEISIHADGASRGNPGEAGAGVVLADERGKTLKEYKSYLGHATNNVAEYRAVLLAWKKLPLSARKAL